MKVTHEKCIDGGTYTWNYKGKAIYATCPRCLGKVRVYQESEEE